MFHNSFLGVTERIHNTIMYMTLLGQDLDFLRSLLQRLHDLLVGLFLIQLLLLFHCILFAGIRQLIFKLLDNIKVRICDLLVILLDFLILSGMLICQSFD